MAWMIGLPVIILVLGIIETIRVAKDKKVKHKEDEVGFTLFLTAILAFFGFGIGLGTAGVVGNSLGQQWNVTSRTEIQSLGLCKDSANHLVLGAGTVGNEPVYYYCRPQANGSTLSYIPAMGTTVVSQDRQDGLITKEEKDFTKSWYNWIGITNDDQRYTLYVPIGTTTTQYSAP